MKEIVIFTLDGCSHCLEVKKILKDNNFNYIDIEITNNSKIWDQVIKQTNHNVVPTVFIKTDNSDEGPIYIPGKDFNSAEELLEKIKKHL